MTEMKLADQMHRVADALQPPTTRLVAGGIDRGRALRRRRRIVQGLAATSLAGAVAVSLFVAPMLFSSIRETQPEFGVASQPQPEKGSSQRSFGVAPDKMAETLAGLLPSGTTSDLRNWSGDAYRAGSLLFDDGLGVAEVDVLVEQVHTWTARPAGSCPASAPPAKRAACRDSVWVTPPDPNLRVQETGNGTLVTFANSPEYPGANTGGVVSNIVAWFKDGFRVWVTAYNAPAEKGQASTRQHPPLTVDQLAAIAQNPVWVK